MKPLNPNLHFFYNMHLRQLHARSRKNEFHKKYKDLKNNPVTSIDEFCILQRSKRAYIQARTSYRRLLFRTCVLELHILICNGAENPNHPLYQQIIDIRAITFDTLSPISGRA